MHPNEIDTEDVSAEILILIVTIPETTSTLICATNESILSHLRVYVEVMREIHTFTSQGKPSSPIASYTQMRNMPYFTSCVYESGRLFLSIPIIPPRRVSSDGITLNGSYIPKGTSISACSPVINQDPGIFNLDLYISRPER